MILIISSVFLPEPIVSAKMASDMAESLSSENSVRVITQKPSRPFGHKLGEFDRTKINYELEILNSFIFPKSKMLGRLRENLSFGLSSARALQKTDENISVIYLNTWPLFAQYLLIRKAHKLKIPVVLQIHDIYPESLVEKLPPIISKIIKTLLMPIEKINLKRSKKIVAISPQMRSFLVENRAIHPEKVSVIRNWHDDSMFLTKKWEKSDSSEFTFMYVGSISASAGVDHIINSFLEIEDKSNLRLVIAGSGSDRDNCTKLAGSCSQIEFWDAPKDRVAEIQSKADILVLSLKKGIGLTASPSKFTAYMLSGKPILASLDLGSDTAISIRKAQSGFVVPPENIIELKNIMCKIARERPEVLRKMGENSKKYGMKHLSRKENLTKMKKLILNSRKSW